KRKERIQWRYLAAGTIRGLNDRCRCAVLATIRPDRPAQPVRCRPTPTPRLTGGMARKCTGATPRLRQECAWASTESSSLEATTFFRLIHTVESIFLALPETGGLDLRCSIRCSPWSTMQSPNASAL